MFTSKVFLLAGGVISSLISILHLILSINPELYRLIGSGQGSPLAQLAEQGSSLTMLATIFLTLTFAIWALYAFSAIGLVRRLPLLRTGIVLIGAIYILRGLFLPTEINMVRNQGYPFQFIIYSSISLLAGWLYLLGYFTQRKLLKPA